jgi:hypothetical protein
MGLVKDTMEIKKRKTSLGHFQSSNKIAMILLHLLLNLKVHSQISPTVPSQKEIIGSSVILFTNAIRNCMKRMHMVVILSCTKYSFCIGH